MAGFSMFNQTTTTTTTTPFAMPSLNTTPTFGALPTQQNVTFGSTPTAFESVPASNASAFGMVKPQPQFGSPSTSLFGVSSATTPQTGLTFGSGTQSATLAQPQPKPAFGGLSFIGTPTSNLTFGTAAMTSQPGLSFGSSPTTAQPGLSFGATPAASQQSLSFAAAPATSQTGLSFAAAPASSQTGLSFAAAPITSQTGLSLAAPAVAPTQTGLSFAAPAVAPTQTGLSFGSAPATSQTGLSFAAPAVAPTQTGLSFGSAPATSQTGLSFGPATMSSQIGVASPLGGFALGTPANTSATPQTGLTFGTLTSAGAATPQTSLSLGIQSAPTQTAFSMPTTTTTQTGLSFAGPSSTSLASLSQAPTLGVAATTATPGPAFGAATGASQPSLTFSTGSTLSTTATTSAPSLFPGLGLSTATSTSAAPNLFGSLTSTANTSTTTTSGGIFSWQKPASDGSTIVSSGTTTIGLGGVDHSAVATTQSAANTITSVKEQSLPNEIQQTVVAFKEHMKMQKNLSNEVAKSKVDQLPKLSQQIKAVKNLILTLDGVLLQQKFTAEKIRLETIKTLNDYELMQKIKDSPVESGERLLSIQKYFTEKISGFEKSIKVLQEKVEYVHRHVSTLSQETSLSAEALKLIVKKLHDSFVVIGARTNKLHHDMQLLKVHYLTLRNKHVADNSSVSFSLHQEFQLPIETRAKPANQLLEGPNPFSRTGNSSFNSLLLASQNRSYAASASNSSVGGLLNTSKPFGFSDISGVSLFDQSTSPGLSPGQQFNLQKPPLGNKRGKR